MHHAQRFVKINVPVDEDIAELVGVLNQFPYLQTIESCQGDEDTHVWISFWYGKYWERPWQDLCEFVFNYLGPGLAYDLHSLATVLVIITENGGIQGELTVKPGAVDRTVQTLKRLVADYPCRGLP